MTTKKLMTREELLETAALDAFGLLDEYDSDRYTQWFSDAPPAVQVEVRRLQAELSVDPSLITVDAEPPFALRERVLAAVAAAIEREEAQLAPLATIGRGRHGDMELMPQRGRLAASGMFWRAAAFVLAAGCILLAYAWSAAVRQGNEIAMLALGRQTESQLQAMIGPDFTDFVKSNGRALALRPVQNDFPGQATLYFDETKEGPVAFLVGLRLPALPDNGEYTLRVKTAADAQPQDVGRFASNGAAAGVRLAGLTVAMLATTASWEVVNSSGEVVLKA
jgi:hypothetical protein